MGPEQLVTQLRAIRDPRMRIRALALALATGDATSWVEAFAMIVSRAHLNDDAAALEALECITHAAADPGVSYETRQQLYIAATTAGHAAIARLFLTASPQVIPPDQVARQLAPERPLKPAGRPLTLGERKSLARTHRREQLLLLIRDPHPAVIAILLDNPHVTESDVVRIAAIRPAVPESLATIAAHPRWSVRHMVKRALVFNPATPLVDAIRIATTLRPAELAELANDPALPEQLRNHAGEVVAAARVPLDDAIN